MGQEGPSVRVVVGADAELAREGVIRCLAEADGVEVVSAVRDLGHLPAYVRGHDADVLLVAPSPERAEDPNLVGQLVEELRQAGSNAPVVVLGYRSDAAIARRALHAGASGYVLVWQSVRDLVEALQLAVRGRLYISARLGVEIARIDEDDHDGLTEREVEVARLAALGYSNSQIGQELFLSTRTIESHRSNLTRKLGVEDRRGLVSWAIEHQMIP
ncbi:MAG: response regulator transcription factor [Solirubrobacteraceae bacterium]|nr:response regulator transcription factor [Solirubrobacteraceae bacterium]